MNTRRMLATVTLLLLALLGTACTSPTAPRATTPTRTLKANDATGWKPVRTAQHITP